MRRLVPVEPPRDINGWSIMPRRCMTFRIPSCVETNTWSETAIPIQGVTILRSIAGSDGIVKPTPATLRHSRPPCLRDSHILQLTGKGRAWTLRLLPHGEKCRQAMRGRAGLFRERCRSAKILISQKISPSSTLREPPLPGGEVVGAFCRLLRQVAKGHCHDRGRSQFPVIQALRRICECRRAPARESRHV